MLFHTNEFSTTSCRNYNLLQLVAIVNCLIPKEQKSLKT